MFAIVHGLMAVSFPGIGGHDLGGLASSLPLSVVLLAAAVVIIAVFGMMSRFRDIFQGKGTAMDFIGLIVVLMILALVVLVMGKGVVRGIRVM